MSTQHMLLWCWWWWLIMTAMLWLPPGSLPWPPRLGRGPSPIPAYSTAVSLPSLQAELPHGRASVHPSLRATLSARSLGWMSIVPQGPVTFSSPVPTSLSRTLALSTPVVYIDSRNFLNCLKKNNYNMSRLLVLTFYHFVCLKNCIICC